MRATLWRSLGRSLGPWLLPALLLSACYRKDPLYCDDKTACPLGQVCQLTQRECAPATADMPAPPDLSTPDLSMSDLAGPDMASECTSPAQCTVASKPVCSAGRCQPCRRNYECPASACDDGGACHDKNKIITVDDTTGACRTSGGPSTMPYCYLADALADAALGAGKDLILLRPSTRGGHFVDGSFLKINKSVRLVGARGSRTDAPVLVREPIQISGSGTSVSVEDIALGGIDKSGPVDAIFCASGTSLSMSWGRVEGAPYSGVRSEGCRLRLVSEQILRNGRTLGSGVTVTGGGELTMYNSIVAENGSYGVFLGTARGGTIAMSTMTANRCGIGGCNLACDLINQTSVSYSIVAGVAAGPGSLSGNCAVSSSVVPAAFMGGTGNLAGFSPVFANPAQADYHLSPTDPINKMLRKNEPSPALPYDLDDDSRPAGAVDIGADQLP